MKKIMIATTNSGKIKEFSSFLQDANIQFEAQSALNIPEVEETGATFIENALLKARHLSKFTNHPVLADDSGLCVDFLQGAPGIYSARFAGNEKNDEKNIAKVLHLLENVPIQKRKASFYCVLVLLRHPNDQRPLIIEGNLNGYICFKPEGTIEKGLGYNPIFYVPTLQSTMANLPIPLRHQISHRGQAITHLIRRLTEQRNAIYAKTFTD